MQSDSQEKLVYLVIVLQIKLNISNVGYFFQIFLKHNFNSELLSGYIFKKNRDICKKKCSSNHLALAFRMGCLLGFFFFFWSVSCFSLSVCWSVHAIILQFNFLCLLKNCLQSFWYFSQHSLFSHADTITLRLLYVVSIFRLKVAMYMLKILFFFFFNLLWFLVVYI